MTIETPNIIRDHVRLDPVKGLPVYIIAKDLNTGAFIGGNENMQRFYNDDLAGRHPEELGINTTDCYYNLHMEGERQTLLQHDITMMPSVNTVRGRLVTSFCLRKPLFDENDNPHTLIVAATAASIDGVHSHERAKFLIGRTEEALGIDTQIQATITQPVESFASKLPVRLTHREQQTLHNLVKGHTAREIAEIIGLSKKTVEFHIDKMKRKFNVSSRSNLLAKVIEEDYFRIQANDNLAMLN